MKKISILLTICAMAVAGCSNAKVTDTVKVENGLVKGNVEDDLIVFRGIPFAAPPVGDLRWKDPQPVEDWDGVLEATEFAPGPIQARPVPSGKSEDCLYLNVWTPAEYTDDKLPVLVWIYGGGFNFGATSEPGYNCANLAQKGVVMVSIAYRVGIPGFFAHPELTAEHPNNASGNYGLLDQIAGLKWIQQNIEAFGGDPDKVTIFGESAGGISVSMLCASPLAKGLFRGAISQSGGSFAPPRPTTYHGENMKRLADAEKDGLAYVERAGVSSLAELRAMDINDLPALQGMAWPIIDGYVIPDDQYKMYEAGNYNDIPILIGYNSDEGLSFSPGTPEAYIAEVNERYGKYADALLKAYPPGTGESLPKAARNLARDATFGWHTWSWARLQAETGNSRVFLYHFDQHPDYSADPERADYGSPHGQDIAYVFNLLSEPYTSKSDKEIADAMGIYWTNFAKYGDPNGEGLPEWQAFTNENPQAMWFNNQPNMGPVPGEEALEVLDDYFEWRRTPEGDAWAK